MSKGFEVYVEYAVKMENVLTNLRNVLSSIKRDILECAPSAKVYLFGSIARGKYTAASDIDILIVVSKIEEIDVYKLKLLIKKKYLGYPIEIHIVDREMVEKWYTRFIEREEMVEI